MPTILMFMPGLRTTIAATPKNGKTIKYHKLPSGKLQTVQLSKQQTQRIHLQEAVHSSCVVTLQIITSSGGIVKRSSSLIGTEK